MQRALLTVLVLAGCLAPAAPLEPAANRTATMPGPLADVPDAEDPAFAGGFSRTHVFPGEYGEEGVFSHVARPGNRTPLAPEVVRLPSATDGETIEIGVLLPDLVPGERVPVVVYASPYFLPMTPARITGDDVPEGALPHTWVHGAYLLENFVPHGYAGALVAVRGSGGSGGCMDLFGPREQADLDQAITWLGTQPWSNGRVAMVGLSYSASTPWEVAATGNPYLATIVAASGLPSIGHFLYYNGTVHAGAHGGLPLTYYPLAFGYDEDPVEIAKGAACAELPPSVAATTTSAFTLDADALGWLAERDHRAGTLANYRGSVLLVQGLDDWRVAPKNAYPFVSDLEAEGVVVKHLLGQWPHANPDSKSAGEHRRLDFAEILLHWFDYWLKGDRTVDLGPRAQVEDSDGRWRSEAAWPPRDATPRALYLAPGALADEPAEVDETIAADANRFPTAADNVLANLGQSSAKPALPCARCPRFVGAPLDAELRIAGLPTLHLDVVPLGPGGHVTAHLFAAGPEGERLLGRGAIDLRVADGGDEPRAVTPNEPLVARLQLEPLDAVLHAGERLVLELHQGGYEERIGAFPTYPARVTAGTLTLPVIERDADAFFTPP